MSASERVGGEAMRPAEFEASHGRVPIKSIRTVIIRIFLLVFMRRAVFSVFISVLSFDKLRQRFGNEFCRLFCFIECVSA